jgi:hypothetical protein
LRAYCQAFADETSSKQLRGYAKSPDFAESDKIRIGQNGHFSPTPPKNILKGTNTWDMTSSSYIDPCLTRSDHIVIENLLKDIDPGLAVNGKEQRAKIVVDGKFIPS